MFDKRNEYKRFVEPYLKRAYEACSMYGIPFFASCCVSDDGKNTAYKNMINGASSNGIKLADDQFSRHINVANGFDTYLNDKYGITEIEGKEDEIPELEDTFGDDF